MCFRRQIAGAVCWPARIGWRLTLTARQECQAIRRPKAPCDAGCSRTEMIYLTLSALLGLLARRIDMPSPPANNCATGAGSVQLPPTRCPATTCVRRRPERTVIVRQCAQCRTICDVNHICAMPVRLSGHDCGSRSACWTGGQVEAQAGPEIQEGAAGPARSGTREPAALSEASHPAVRGRAAGANQAGPDRARRCRGRVGDAHRRCRQPGSRMAADRLAAWCDQAGSPSAVPAPPSRWRQPPGTRGVVQWPRVKRLLELVDLRRRAATSTAARSKAT